MKNIDNNDKTDEKSTYNSSTNDPTLSNQKFIDISQILEENHITKSVLYEINKSISKQLKIINNQSSHKRSRIMFKKEDDDKINELVKKFGTHNWSLIASFLNGKSAKQCRDRYTNYLVPGFFQGEWSKDEDELLKKLFVKFGSKWSILQKSFPGRSAISIKNRWTYFLSKQKNQYENNVIENENNKDIFKNLFSFTDEHSDDYYYFSSILFSE